MQFFLMIISGRSGSSYLRQLLNQDSHLLMLGEMLAKKNDAEQKKAIDDFFDGKIGENNYQGKKALLGFKTKINDIADSQFFLRKIKTQNPKIIINRRKNYLRQAISRARMLILLENTIKKYGEAHHSPKCKNDIVPPIKVDVNSIYKFTKDFEQRDKILANLSKTLKNEVEMETIYYEDFAADPKIAINRLSKILGLNLKIKDYNITYKNTSTDLTKAILNYDELKARLENTKYLAMLENA